MPRGQRPRSRTMAVLVEVSSMNTSRAGSNMPCSRIQRRRARATSARFCSAACRLFFEADRVPLEEAPHRAAAAGDPSLAHRRDDLIQRQIRSVGNQHQQKVRVRLQGRDAAPARLGGYTSGFLLPLHPFDGRTRTHCEPFRGLASRCAGRDGLHYSLAQLQRTWLRHRSASKNRISAARFSHSNHPGNTDSTKVKSALIIALTARHKLPAVYPYRYHVASGGLICCGPEELEQYRQAASYVD